LGCCRAGRRLLPPRSPTARRVRLALQRHAADRNGFNPLYRQVTGSLKALPVVR
jgi:hypothetical protein